MCAIVITSVTFLVTERGAVLEERSQNDAKGCEQAHVRAVNLGPSLANLGRGWVRLSEDVIAVRSTSLHYVDTTLAPSDALLWLRTTLVRFSDGTWQVEEFCQNIHSDFTTCTQRVSSKV